MFKEGDEVILLDNYVEGIESRDWCEKGGLKIGEIYRVRAVRNEKDLFIEECINQYILKAYRFEKAENTLSEAEEF